jgi:hypothetical protein
MLAFELLRDKGILVVHPQDRLEAGSLSKA